MINLAAMAYRGFPIPPIRCAVCDRQVADASWQYSDNLMAHVVVVRCHGDTETCMLGDEVLEDGDEVVEAVAFAQKKIGAD